MRTFYREKKYYCSDYLEVDIYPVHKMQTGRKRKAKPTSTTMKALNDLNAEKKLIRLLNTNFTSEDIKCELTYNNDNLPKSDEEAEKELRNFFRRLKRFRMKNGLPELKYVVVTEKGKKSGRYHHHVIMSGGLLPSDIIGLWGKGIINTSPLQFDETGISALAKYMLKDKDKKDPNKKSWHASRNLKKPKESTNDTRISKRKAKELWLNADDRKEFEKLYPDYFFASCRSFYNDINGGFYLCIQMYRKNRNSTQVEKKKRRKKK